MCPLMISGTDSIPTHPSPTEDKCRRSNNTQIKSNSTMQELRGHAGQNSDLIGKRSGVFSFVTWNKCHARYHCMNITADTPLADAPRDTTADSTSVGCTTTCTTHTINNSVTICGDLIIVIEISSPQMHQPLCLTYLPGGWNNCLPSFKD